MNQFETFKSAVDEVLASTLDESAKHAKIRLMAKKMRPALHPDLLTALITSRKSVLEVSQYYRAIISLTTERFENEVDSMSLRCEELGEFLSYATAAITSSAHRIRK